MLVLHGTGVSSGISIGQAYVLRRQQPEVLKYVLPRNLIDEEIERFRQALELARTHNLSTSRIMFQRAHPRKSRALSTLTF